MTALATVNGVPTAPDAHGIVQGGSGTDFISGTGGNDTLQGNGGGDVYFGGGGSDTFIIKNTDLVNGPSSVNNVAATDVIYDFSGAGAWQAQNNDFIAFEHFGAGSTLTFDRYGGNPDGSQNVQLQYYTVHDTTTNGDYTIFIKSLDSSLLAHGDYNFYL